MQRYDTRCKGCNQVYPCIIPCTENSLRKDNEGRFVLYSEAREIKDEQDKQIVELKTDMIMHFHKEHLQGDGPEIDRWKRQNKELTATISRQAEEIEKLNSELTYLRIIDKQTRIQTIKNTPLG